jgi:bacterioferritin-associated ferredoxin
MYLCICNALTERQIEALIDEGIGTLSDLYAALQCRPQCGKCIADIHHKMRTHPGMTAPLLATAAPGAGSRG